MSFIKKWKRPKLIGPITIQHHFTKLLFLSLQSIAKHYFFSLFYFSFKTPYFIFSYFKFKTTSFPFLMLILLFIQHCCWSFLLYLPLLLSKLFLSSYQSKDSKLGRFRFAAAAGAFILLKMHKKMKMKFKLKDQILEQ